ncbi:MAG: hypothetical protein JNM63_12205, partial [Spirochaetia bacterium]|nr:hypothetical protein [Spirochaetia bacterium]
MKAFNRFHHQADVDMLRYCRARVKEYAQSKDKKLPISGNIAPVLNDIDSLRIIDCFDYMNAETRVEGMDD